MQLQSIVFASVLSALDSNFGKESSSIELSDENIAHDIRSVDTKFVADPGTGTWDVSAWLNSGELEGFNEVTTGLGSRDELTHASLNAIDAEKSDVDTVVAECEVGLTKVYRSMRLLNYYLGNTVTPKAQPDWERAVTHARIELGDTRDELGDWPKKPIGRCFTKYREFRRTLKGMLSQASTTQMDVLSRRNPHLTVWMTSDRDCDFHESNHLVSGLHSRSADVSAYTYYRHDDDILLSEQTISADEPSAEWGQHNYRNWKDSAGSLSMANPAVHRHYGYFASLRASRETIIREWMAGNVKRAYAVAGYAPAGNTVTTERGKLYKMSKLEQAEWTKRQLVIAGAWSTGKIEVIDGEYDADTDTLVAGTIIGTEGPDWRETSILTFPQMRKLKSEAWAVIKA